MIDKLVLPAAGILGSLKFLSKRFASITEKNGKNHSCSKQHFWVNEKKEEKSNNNLQRWQSVGPKPRRCGVVPGFSDLFKADVLEGREIKSAVNSFLSYSLPHLSFSLYIKVCAPPLGGATCISTAAVARGGIEPSECSIVSHMDMSPQPGSGTDSCWHLHRVCASARACVG